MAAQQKAQRTMAFGRKGHICFFFCVCFCVCYCFRSKEDAFDGQNGRGRRRGRREGRKKGGKRNDGGQE